jgi:hypothetical protein
MAGDRAGVSCSRAGDWNPGSRSHYLLRRWLAAIRRAAALAFTRVLAFAAIVTRLATPLALTGVLALASVLIRLGLTHLQRNARFPGWSCRVGRGGERAAH